LLGQVFENNLFNYLRNTAELKWNAKVKSKLTSFVDEYMDKLPGVYEAKNLK
jgi:hypothetical protein